jgi:hypothetical protein
MMRVLFLDFDGVLHPGPGVVSSLTHWCWLPVLAQLLARQDDVRIVVHSTWRDDHDIGELRELLSSVGERVIGATPEGGRLESIERWLEAHPDVSSYRILDDDESDFFHPLPPELILCDSARGIGDKRAQQQLLSWLAETPSR